MAKTYGEDLRERVIAAVDSGLSRRAAAERFKVAFSTAIKWVRAWREHGRRVAKPYSPDVNPIELAFAKLKALLRRAAARTIPDLWDAIARALPTFTQPECANYFTACGYEPD